MDEQDHDKPVEEDGVADDIQDDDVQPDGPEDDDPVDEFKEVIQKSQVLKQRQKDRKRKIKNASIVGGLLVFGYIVYLLFVPYKGDMNFGICKVFLERYVTFPSTLTLNSFEEFSDSIRIWHMHTDAFGEARMEPIQCWYKIDENTGLLALKKVTIKRREIPQDVVEQFNKSIPAIYSNPPDLTLPYPLSDKLENLYFEENTFVKPIL